VPRPIGYLTSAGTIICDAASAAALGSLGTLVYAVHQRV